MKILSAIWNFIAKPFPNHFTAVVFYIGALLFTLGFWAHGLWAVSTAALLVIIVVGALHVSSPTK